MSDDYVDLVEKARDALYDVLKASEPGTGLLLHQAYAELKRTVARADGAEAPTLADIRRHREEEERRWKDEERAARCFKRHTTPREREQLVLTVLDGERWTSREVCDRLREQLPHFDIYRTDSVVTGAIKRLYDAGDLGREKITRGKREVWCYFRKTSLDGPIADLDRAFREGESR